MDSVHKEALHDRLMAMRPGRIEPGLSRVRRVAVDLSVDFEGHGTQWVLVAGTNGKGSTVAFLSAILQASGARVGRYTSPHLVDVTERIQVNSEAIEAGDFTRHGVAVLASAEACGVELTYFEVVTLVALLHFEAEDIEFGILEVGLGGRLDATNIVNPRLSILTTIGMDHMEFLGDSIEAIAWEKGGITRPEVPLITGLPDSQHEASLRDRIAPATVWRVERDFGLSSEGEAWVYRSALGERGNLRLALEGAHQLHNAALAIAGAEILDSSMADAAVREGLISAELPGRLQWIRRTDAPDFLLDGAHNLAAAEALRVTLDGLPPAVTLVGVMASRSGKDPEAFAAILGERVSAWAATTAPDTPRMLPADEVLASLEEGKRRVLGSFEDPAEALSQAERAAGPEGIVLVTGSLFVIGALQRGWQQRA